ncbi:hypothetical protein [Aeromicrobium sp. UC242_57]|uniref:hypothetical protein n=1 Tax=Aeromicrobium sp. UC242_57 TaxID=3374624 RepID=UPI003790BB74
MREPPLDADATSSCWRSAAPWITSVRVVEHEPHYGPDVEHLFQQLGYREAQDGHSLDAMRAAYQIATREARIHLHDLAARRAIPADLLPQLTQALFFYMQWLTEQVTLGHADGEPKAGDDGVVTARHQLTRRLLDGRSSPSVEQLSSRRRLARPQRSDRRSSGVRPEHPLDRSFDQAAARHT